MANILTYYMCMEQERNYNSHYEIKFILKNWNVIYSIRIVDWLHFRNMKRYMLCIQQYIHSTYRWKQFTDWIQYEFHRYFCISMNEHKQMPSIHRYWFYSQLPLKFVDFCQHNMESKIVSTKEMARKGKAAMTNTKQEMKWSKRDTHVIIVRFQNIRIHLLRHMNVENII